MSGKLTDGRREAGEDALRMMCDHLEMKARDALDRVASLEAALGEVAGDLAVIAAWSLHEGARPAKARQAELTLGRLRVALGAGLTAAQRKRAGMEYDPTALDPTAEGSA